MAERKFGLGVVIYIFNKDLSKVLLLKRNGEKRKKGGAEWGNVGGRVELGELLLDACLREAKEEIGVQLDSQQLRLIEIKETPYLSEIFHALHFFYATTLNETEKITLNEESEDYQWFELKNLPDGTLDPKEDFYKAHQKFLSSAN